MREDNQTENQPETKAGFNTYKGVKSHNNVNMRPQRPLFPMGLMFALGSSDSSAQPKPPLNVVVNSTHGEKPSAYEWRKYPARQQVVAEV